MPAPARVTTMPAAVDTSSAGILRTRARRRRSGACRSRRQREREVIAQEASHQAADDVDAGDRQTRDGVAADELAGAVHGPEEFGLALEGATCPCVACRR